MTPPNTRPPQPQPSEVKKIDIEQLMKVAAEAGAIIRKAEEREKQNELRDSQK